MIADRYPLPDFPFSAASARRLAAEAGLALVLAALPVLAVAQAGGHVGGSGRIQPGGGVVALSGPAGRQVERIEIKEGSKVKKGAVLLVTADRSMKTVERDLAAERLRAIDQQAASKARVAELDIESARLQLTRAREDLAAIAGLDERAIAPREKRQREHAVATADTALRQASARLQEIRNTMDSEKRTLRSSLELAQAQLAATQLVAPADGTVIELSTFAGATLGSGAALTLADTSTMIVAAEFFEGDLDKLKPGMRAKIKNAALGGEQGGVLDSIGRVVDPASRLAKARIRLDRPSPADRFIGMQVDVTIDVAGGVPAAKPAAAKPAAR